MRNVARNIALKVSTVLCLALGFIWLGSSHNQMGWSIAQIGYTDLYAANGYLSLIGFPIPVRPRHLNMWIVRYCEEPGCFGAMWSLSTPIWFPFGLTSILPLHALIQHRRQLNAARTNHCTTCGYDLRASSVRCPECGEAFVSLPSPSPSGR